MRLFLCQDCLSLLADWQGHVCRAPYPKTGRDSDIARIGVPNMRCIGKLWRIAWKTFCEDTP